jgi:hypothetical protein
LTVSCFLRTMVIYQNRFFEILRTGSEQGWTRADNRFLCLCLDCRNIVIRRKPKSAGATRINYKDRCFCDKTLLPNQFILELKRTQFKICYPILNTVNSTDKKMVPKVQFDWQRF